MDGYALLRRRLRGLQGCAPRVPLFRWPRPRTPNYCVQNVTTQMQKNANFFLFFFIVPPQSSADYPRELLPRTS